MTHLQELKSIYDRKLRLYAFISGSLALALPLLLGGTVISATVLLMFASEPNFNQLAWIVLVCALALVIERVRIWFNKAHRAQLARCEEINKLVVAERAARGCPILA